jgi:hypothetical protein
MSERRRLKRAKLRNGLSTNIDWAAIKKNSYIIIVASAVVFTVVFLFSLWVVQSHNAIRKTASKNHTTTYGKVISLSGGKGPIIATYEFSLSKHTYSGKTFTAYDGEVGDRICIKYSTEQPEINLCCEDDEMETIFDDVFLSSISTAAITLVLCVAVIFIQLLLKKH